MRTSALIVAASLLLVSCGNGTPPAAYKHPRDRFFAVVPLPMINDDFMPCHRTIAGEPGVLPNTECYNFTDQRRMRGVAIMEFETGGFYPGQRALPDPDQRSEIWVKPDPRILPPNVRSRCTEGCAVYLEFLGRRTAVQGRYGHMGLAKHIVVVDRVLTADVLN